MATYISLITAFIISLFINLFLIQSSKHHIHISGDHNLQLPQKIHTKPTPRIGGMSIFLGVIVGVLAQKSQLINLQTSIILCAIPAYLIGMYEDISKKISPAVRFSFIGISAILELCLNDVVIKYVDIQLLDFLLANSIISMFFSIFAIIGLTNAYNIIDGLNGLSTILSFTALTAIALISYSVNDYLILYLSILLIISTFGFFIFNFPYGKIFLGDGGAYFLGVLISVLSILLISRNQTISPWFAITINIYPICETIISIYRRAFKGFASISRPDDLHMHSVVFSSTKYLVSGIRDDLRNPFASLVVASPSIFIAALTVVSYKNMSILLLITIIYLIFYIYTYRKLSFILKSQTI